MPKHLDAVPSLNDFRAPWETADGSEAEIDKPRLRKFIHGLMTDKAKAQDAREAAAEQVTTLEADLTEARKQAESANGEEATKKITKLENDLAAAKSDLAKMEKEKTRSDLLHEAGLTEKHAKYVTGETEDEIKKSIEDVKKDFGLDEEREKEEEEEGEPEFEGFVRPTTRLKTPGDPKGGKEPASFDPEKIAAQLVGRDLI